MNIFPTDLCPLSSAQALDDKRVVRQASEAVIILDTALQVRGHPGHYAIHQPEHALIQWLAGDDAALSWGWEYALACNMEYTRRYAKACVCHEILLGLAPVAHRVPSSPATFCNVARNKALSLDFTDEPNVRKAYRAYLNARWLLDKRKPTWREIAPPLWKHGDALAAV